MVFDLGAELTLGRTLFISFKWRDGICPKHTICLQSTDDSTVQVTSRVMLAVQPEDIHMRVQFSAVDKLSVSWLVETLLNDRFLKGSLPMEHCILPTGSLSLDTVSEYIPLSNLLLSILQTKSDARISRIEGQDNNIWTRLFRVAESVLILQSTLGS